MTGRLNLPIFLLALAIAIVIKIAVQEAEQISEAAIDAKVTYDRPDGLVILEPVEQVKVRLRGKRSSIIQVQANPFLVRVVVKLGERQIGTVAIHLEDSDIDVPGDLEVLSIDPNNFALKVEPVAQATLPIRVQLVGEPAAGATVGEVIIRPAEAEVSGPKSQVEALASVSAGPVSLNGHALTFEETVSVVSPDPLVRILRPNKVVVRVTMQEPELSGAADTPATRRRERAS